MNNNRDYPSEEMLNALLDGELSSEERASLLNEMQHDKKLSAEFCELRMIKDAVQLAHMDLPLPEHCKPRKKTHWLSLAAGFLLFGVGILLGGIVQQQSIDDKRFAILDPAGLGAAPAVTENNEMRIVFHLTQPDVAITEELLAEVEEVLGSSQQEGVPLRVEVVANNQGLYMLREGLSKHADRIASLSEAYPNLTFVACENTIRRLRVENGIEVVLIPQAEMTESGISHVAKRQQEGWSYIRL